MGLGSRWSPALGMRDVGDVSLRRGNETRDAAIGMARCALGACRIGTAGRNGRSPGAPDRLGVPRMSVLGMLAWFAAAVSLWLGARRCTPRLRPRLPVAGRGRRLVLCRAHHPAGTRLGAQPRIRAVVCRPAAAAGRGRRRRRHRDADHGGTESGGGPPSAARSDGNGSLEGAHRPGPARAGGRLRDGGRPAGDRLGDPVQRGVPPVRRPARHLLLALIHPLADLAVLGALLPMVTTAWRRVMLPYLALLAVLVGDAVGVGQRALGGHPRRRRPLLAVVAALLLGAAPWRVAAAPPRPYRWRSRRTAT